VDAYAGMTSTSTVLEGDAAAPELVELGPGVFAYVQPDGSWYVNNTGFVVGRDRVLVIDACATERRTRAFRAAIAGVTDAPVTTVVNTHHHGDHTYGNSVFTDATILGHRLTRVEVLAAGPAANTGLFTPVEWGELTLRAPEVTYDRGVQLWSDERRVDVRWTGRTAHTTNDSTVWLPQEKVLYAGDLLFNGGTPFLLMGSLPGALAVLETLADDFPAQVVVPGHGPVADLSLVDTVAGYLRFVLGVAEQGLADGLSPLLAAQRAELGRYADWLDPERLVGNLHRGYAELDPGRGAVDLLAALLDMVTYNDGQPLTCDA